LSIWEQCGVVLWYFGGGGGGMDSYVAVVWKGSMGWTRGKRKYALETTVWTSGEGGGIC